MLKANNKYPITPDGRYFIVRGRLWRLANPALSHEQRVMLVTNLMDARRLLRGTQPLNAREDARRAVDEAKRSLGERGPVWWTDGAPDQNRKLVKNSSYAAWFATLEVDNDH